MNSYPLVTHAAPDDTLAWRHGKPITVREFLRDVRRLAAALPVARHMLNACTDRYFFTVGLAAALVSERISLLPPSHTREAVRRMKAFAPDVFCLLDNAAVIDLPCFVYPDDQARQETQAGALWPQGAFVGEDGVPMIPADRTLAFIFTSGSTGVPVPHRKSWGGVVCDVRAEAAALMLPSGARPAVVGTVPPQHMYGIESTVLMPLQAGAALSAAHPFYPADICGELEAVPAPRMLVTTPVHLRALVDAGVQLPPTDLVLSATAPLSPVLAAAVEERFGVTLQEIYGSTETGQIATRRSTASLHWRLLPGISLRPADDGRMWASGGHIEQDTPLGDVIELAGEGSFLLHGRLGDLVNIAGKRNSIAYLNHQLLEIEGVADGAFFMPDTQPGDAVQRLIAFVVAPGLDAAALREALRERIDPIFMPRPLVMLDALPRNSTGKLAREALEALVLEHVGGQQVAGVRDAA
jgi:acyl-coenzyme A synthetase/AMP-(fatty) acid ligase